MVDSAVRSTFDLLRPRVLALLVGLPFVALILWIGIGWLAGPYLQNWLAATMTAWELQPLLQDAGSLVLIVLLLILLFPLVYWTSLVLVSIFALPYILRFLKPQYPKVPAVSGGELIGSWTSMLKVFVVAVPLYILLLFLIWLPFVYAVGTFVLGAWVNYQFLSLEILSEFVDRQKARELIKKNQLELWIMGGGLVFLLGVPFIQMITPVFAGLWFSHWWLKKLSSF